MIISSKIIKMMVSLITPVEKACKCAYGVDDLHHAGNRLETFRNLLTGAFADVKLNWVVGERLSARTFARLYSPQSSRYRTFMELTEADLQEFMQLWREEFNESIAIGDARQCARALLDLYAFLSSPDPERGL